MDNRIDAAFTEAQQKEAKVAMDALEAALPFLYDLTPEERRDLDTLGDKSRTFVDTALVVAQTHPDVLPRAFDVEQFETDVALFREMEPLLVRLRSLLERVEDTRMLVGAEAMGASRAVYYYTKGHPGAAALNEASEALGRRYHRRRPKPDKPGGATP